jgi:endonuclease YncB( thermonuclease family)
MLTLAAALLLAQASSTAPGLVESIQVAVSVVHAGDTVTVVSSSGWPERQFVVELRGVRAPQPESAGRRCREGAPWSCEAVLHTSLLCGTRDARLILWDGATPTNGRYAGKLRCGRQDVAESLARSGLAVATVDASPAVVAMEDEAFEERRGMWGVRR